VARCDANVTELAPELLQISWLQVWRPTLRASTTYRIVRLERFLKEREGGKNVT